MTTALSLDIIFCFYVRKYISSNRYPPSAVCCFVSKLFVLSELNKSVIDLVLLNKQYIPSKEQSRA